MAEQVKPRVRVPSQAKKGDVIEIKTLVSHPMESGQRRDRENNPIPRKIINKFVAKYNGQEVFRADLEPAIAANPFLSFFLKVNESGTLDFAWTDDDGSVYTAQEKITVA